MNLEPETKEKMQTKKIKSSKGKLVRSIVVLIAIAALLGGITYAWFFNQMDISTLIKIQPPSEISILGPNGSQLNSLDLSYTEKDKDADNKVTIRRVFCVQSQDDFNLEIVHTTNMKGLKFTLYPAKAENASDDSETYSNKVTDGGYTYKYGSSPFSGSYINATSAGDYKYANGTQHSTNYGTYSNVQKHAEPIYWLVKNSENTDNENKLVCDKANSIDINKNGTSKTYYRTYFVCEISWTEDTKETDIFYILAQNA